MKDLKALTPLLEDQEQTKKRFFLRFLLQSFLRFCGRTVNKGTFAEVAISIFMALERPLSHDRATKEGFAEHKKIA